MSRVIYCRTEPLIINCASGKISTIIFAVKQIFVILCASSLKIYLFPAIKFLMCSVLILLNISRTTGSSIFRKRRLSWSLKTLLTLVVLPVCLAQMSMIGSFLKSLLSIVASIVLVNIVNFFAIHKMYIKTVN